ncbi:MAG: lipopolysaccharide core heptose(I) kinase RfaP [Gammaproteobacteria bacterium]|nr:MAG: lipopolysaccharide core heptose(I) kinase RfaP [Gammaproteobacteria bacterium]
MKLILRGALQKEWANKDVFALVQQLEGEIFRDKEGRQTRRFSYGGNYYFRKLHSGIGWLEIVKNFSQAKMPVLGAINEWQAINRVKALGLDTLNAVAYGKKGWNPATQLSFLVTEELTETISLEDYGAKWLEKPPSLREKRAIITRVACIARTIHQAGINHRDLYICHFLLDQSKEARQNKLEPRLFLVDLHRAQIRNKVPTRWLVKDIASIYFSSLDIGLTRGDVLRFLQVYFDAPLRDTLVAREGLLARVTRRAIRVYQREFGRIPRLP